MIAKLGTPFVVKPVNQAGSLGVHIVSSKEDYQTKILHNHDYRFSPLIAQQFIDGNDIDASLLSFDGRMSALAIQQASRSVINFVPNEYLEQVSAEICKVSAYHGVMHIDARIEQSSGKVFLIEVNPRFWASLTAAVWCGLNFVAESLYHPPGRRNVLKLTDGKAFTRHPAIRPHCWPHLAFDQGHRGRLVRASVFDPWSISHLASDLPSMCLRFAKRKVSLRSELSRQK
jgi:predicted ATP-grasp superfamily ATP-dependent carboligase